MSAYRIPALAPFVLIIAAFETTSCATVLRNPHVSQVDPTTQALEKLAEQATPGILGAAVLDLQTGALSSVNGNTPLPLQSVFKLPLSIYVMHLAETGVISLEERVTLSQSDLSIFYSPITEAFAHRQSYTIRELVAAAVSDSDNTAADWLLERTGGPKALSKFFQARGLRQFRVDRYERELQPESVGLPASAGQMTDSDAYQRYRASIPIEARTAGMQRYLADPRDRMSAVDAVRLLAMLNAGRLLNRRHTLELMEILVGTPSGPNRLKAGVPTDVLVYHKTGSSADVGALNGATNDIGIIALPDGRRFAVSAFLSGSSRPIEERERLIADVGAAAVQVGSSR